MVNNRFPKAWQTPEAQDTLAGAMNRAITRALSRADAGALRGCTVDDLHRLPEIAAGTRRALPRGNALDARVKLAKQGDKLAAYEVHRVLATDLRRGTLALNEIDLLASMHEAIARGTDPASAMLLTRPANRPSKIRMQAFICDWLTREIDAHRRIKAKGGTACDNGCNGLSNAAAFRRAGEIFELSAGRVKTIYADRAK